MKRTEQVTLPAKQAGQSEFNPRMHVKVERGLTPEKCSLFRYAVACLYPNTCIIRNIIIYKN